MRAVWLVALAVWPVALLMACDPISSTQPSESVPRRDGESTGFPFYPHCEQSTETGPWAADCVERCLPPTEMVVLCHSGGPPHLYLADASAAPVGEYARVVDPAPWDCTDDAAWRIYSIVWDPHHWGELDVTYVSSWPAATMSDCAKPAPSTATKDYFERHWDRPYFTATEVAPTE